MTNSCAYCAQPGSQHCTSCKAITYCSPSCQTSDWETHKHICKTFTNFDKSTRPENHHLAFFFPTNEDDPDLIWLKTEYVGPQRLAVTNFKAIDKLLDRPASATPMLIQTNERLGRFLEHLLNLWHRDTFLSDGSKLNESVVRVAPTSYWRGPLVAVAQVGQELNPHRHRDVTPVDFRNLVDHFLAYADRLGKGAGSVDEADLPVAKVEILVENGDRARCSASVVARLATFREIMREEDFEAALWSMSREEGDGEAFATLQRLVEIDKERKAGRGKGVGG